MSSDTYTDEELGLSAYPTPLNFAPTRLVNSAIIPGPVRVEGWTVGSTNTISQYVLWFDGMELPASGAVPINFQPVSSNNNASAYFGERGRIFQRGLVLVTSSTPAVYTANATADVFIDVQYEPVPL